MFTRGAAGRRFWNVNAFHWLLDPLGCSRLLAGPGPCLGACVAPRSCGDSMFRQRGSRMPCGSLLRTKNHLPKNPALRFGATLSLALSSLDQPIRRDSWPRPTNLPPARDPPPNSPPSVAEAKLACGFHCSLLPAFERCACAQWRCACAQWKASTVGLRGVSLSIHGSFTLLTFT